MTPSQLRILQAIRTILLDTRCNPSFGEIGEACGLRSLATVSKHIVSLEANGYIKRKPNRTRSIALTPLALEHLSNWGRSNYSKSYYAALQRIAEALGIPAGIELTDGTPERAIATLKAQTER